MRRLQLFAALAACLASCASGTARLERGVTVANRAASKSGLPLSAGERTLLAAIFGPTLDLDPIRLVSGSLAGTGTARTVQNVIYFTPAQDVRRPAFRASDEFLRLLVHEATHVWQFQNVGIRYIADSLYDQAVGGVTHGTRLVAYRYEVHPEVPFSKLGTEAQGKLIEDYALARLIERRPGGCDGCEAETPASFAARVEPILRRDVNPEFVPLDRAAVLGALGR
ncbi:MAG: hypothetical protein H6744_18255 [Deltaproteobacteria bacterium]|nr:hypothetical protein [Deltaproteobacteria bacterium]